jgi:hypothetical protein
MLEFRKDIFADERDDNLVEIGQPTQRQDMLGHVRAIVARCDCDVYFKENWANCRYPITGMISLQYAVSCPTPRSLRQIAAKWFRRISAIASA